MGLTSRCQNAFCSSAQCAQAQLQTAPSTSPQKCSRCADKVVRVEEAGIGSIWMCSHGGTRSGTFEHRKDLFSWPYF